MCLYWTYLYIFYIIYIYNNDDVHTEIRKRKQRERKIYIRRKYNKKVYKDER